MVADDRHDRLIDALLWELHGETASPDLRARVVAAAVPTRRRAVRRALAAAAVLLAAVVGWMAVRGRYPRPRAEGDFELIREGAAVDPASALRRGDRLVAGTGGAELHLGGYCKLQLDPHGELIVAGEPGKEVVELENGKLASRIVSERGEFRVVTPLGWLDVRGTEFVTSVERREATKGASAVGKLRKRVVVSVVVLSGIVAFQFGESTGLLWPGMSQAFGGEKKDAPRLPEGIRGFKGMMIGTIVSKTEDSFVLKVEKITRVWKESKAKEPECVVGKEVPITLWKESRLADRHRKTLAEMNKGDRIEVEPFHLEGERLSVVEGLKKVGREAPEEPKEKEAPAEFPEGIQGFKGMFVGTIVEKGSTFFTLKVEKIAKVWKGSTAKNPACAVGKSVKMTLRREGRILERLVRQLAELKPGDRVQAGAFHIEADVFAGVEMLKKAE